MDSGDMNSGVGPQRFGDPVSVDRPERWGELGASSSDVLVLGRGSQYG